MKKGKFEARSGKAAVSAAPGAVSTQNPAEAAAAAERGGRFVKQAEGRRPDWLLILIPVLVVLAVAAIITVGLMQDRGEAADVGLTKEQTLDAFRQAAEVLEHQDMVLTLTPEPAGPGDIPIVITIPPAKSKVKVDLAGVEQDLEAGKGKISRRRYDLKPEEYITMDRSVLREAAEKVEAKYAQPFLQSFYTVSTITEGTELHHVLTVNTGRRELAVSADAITEALVAAYMKGEMAPELHYSARTPEPLDAMAIGKACNTRPSNAQLNEETFEITPEVPGYGIDELELEQLLLNARPGEPFSVTLGELPASITKADIEASLFSNVLGEAHTPHTWNDDRTVNLMRACEAIDGKILMPGEVFSFNETVGERTANKGYREATVYVGGNSVPELGGGVCQVASSIYYAALQADLEIVDRHCHTYLVTYVPMGMDATIYWGALDFQFKNSSPSPIRIDATVASGDVHIILRGREWKDYSVKLSYEVLEEIPYETTERLVPNDGTYKNGDTLVSPYTGYRVNTYRTVIDREGNKRETTKIAYSRYSKRDKVIAVLYTPPATEPAPSETNGSD